MKIAKLPWEIHPELTKDRLTKVASLIAEARHQVMQKYEPNIGDDAWCTSCRAYSAIRKTIRNASMPTGKYSDWLEVLEDNNLIFTFSISGVPLKFYMGDPDRPPERSLKRRFPEARAQQQAFEFIDNDILDSKFRLLIETDDNGEVDSVTFLEIDQTNISRNCWAIPISEESNVMPISEESVDLQPAKIKPKRSKTKSVDKTN